MYQPKNYVNQAFVCGITTQSHHLYIADHVYFLLKYLQATQEVLPNNCWSTTNVRNPCILSEVYSIEPLRLLLEAISIKNFIKTTMH